EACEHYDIALSPRPEKPGGDSRERETYARYLDNLAVSQVDTGQFQEADANYDEAQKILTDLVEREKAVASHHYRLAHVLNNRAELHKRRNQLDSAESFYQSALAHLELLAASFPQVPDYQADLARTIRAFVECLLQKADS